MVFAVPMSSGVWNKMKPAIGPTKTSACFLRIKAEQRMVLGSEKKILFLLPVVCTHDTSEAHIFKCTGRILSNAWEGSGSL